MAAPCEDYPPETPVVEVLRMFDVSTEVLRRVARFMDAEMTRGLGPAGSSMFMFPAFVTRHRPPTASGHFLGLDLGGTNFRVVVCHLVFGKLQSEQVRVFAIPTDRMKGVPGALLFDFLAQCVEEVVADIDQERAVDAALAFAFGMELTGLQAGRIVTWSKGIDLPDVVGCDVLGLLAAALARRGLQRRVRLVAVLNDSVGTFLSGLADDPETRAAVIVGTGTNMCYFEQRARITKLPLSEDDPHGEMLMNSEWGALNDHGQGLLPRTELDEAADRASLFPGQQVFEKMIAGKGLAHLFCLALDRLQRQLGAFGTGCRALPEGLAVEAPLLARLVEDSTADLDHVRALCRQTFGWDAGPADRRVVQAVASAILRRAGRLLAAGVWAVAQRLGCVGRCGVAVDGSVYEGVPLVRRAVAAALDELAGGAARHGIRLRVAKDGSGRGAALLAALQSDPA